MTSYLFKTKVSYYILEIMETSILKNRILKFVENADKRVLSIANGVFENYYNKDIVAFILMKNQ